MIDSWDTAEKDWCIVRTKKISDGEVNDEVMCDATHPAERQDERQDGDVAYNRGEEQKNIDADQRRRLASSVRIQTVTKLNHEAFHQPPGVIDEAGRRLCRYVGNRGQVIWR